MPAEQTSTSIGPSSAVAAATAASTSAETDDVARERQGSVEAATGSRSNVATFAPSASRRVAVAAPIPLAAPVTSATRPENR